MISPTLYVWLFVFIRMLSKKSMRGFLVARAPTGLGLVLRWHRALFYCFLEVLFKVILTPITYLAMEMRVIN